MDKMRMESVDMTAQNIEKIGALFPNCITETVDEDGNPRKAINFEMLKQMLSDDVLDGDEAYEFTWVGKKASIVEANKPIRKTLRPCKEESVDWDNTENLYIEGDNLEVLKLLQESYLGKVKMIYIDPPYNTGNDFIYRDDFAQSVDEYQEQMGMFDEETGARLFKNTDSNGRFHSDWCSMIYSRLMLARNLLTDDGVIFISIDDNEQENLKKICDAVFGKENAVIPFIWLLPRGINAGLVARAHEYVLCYTKNYRAIKNFNRTSDKLEYSIERCNKKIDSRHPESTITFPAGIPYEGNDKTITGVIEGSEKVTIIGEMVFKDGKLAKPVTLSAGWTMKNMILDWLNGKKVYDLKGQEIEGFFFKENGKLYSKKVMSTVSIKSILKDMPDTQIARKEMELLFGNQDIFSYPKTLELPKLFTKLSCDKDDIILDFFSGSATTAHAVMQLNAEDGGHRKFIMVQLPEETDEKSEAYKAGYKNICEIGKERIRRAGDKIKTDSPLTTQDLDTGFRVLKLDDSNMNDVYYSPNDYSQGMLSMLESNVKSDRTDLDLLFGCLLEWGLPLSLPYSSEKIDGCTVHNYNDGDLIACFDENVPDSVIKEIAKRQPLRAVFRDSSFANSPSKINVGEIFKLMAPDTRVKVI
jgi:adenine-specific DNA-methyltransferase